jgi:hypothetical protein
VTSMSAGLVKGRKDGAVVGSPLGDICTSLRQYKSGQRLIKL